MAQLTTAHYDKGLNAVNTIQSAAEAGFNFAVGTLECGSYTTGGLTFPLNFNNTDFVAVGPASDVIFEYDYTNEKLKVRTAASNTVAGTMPLAEIADGTDISDFTALPFVAFGH